MTNLMRGSWLAAAALVLAVGCGEFPGTDAGNGCSTDANCGTGRVCHPVLKECVSSCTGGSDCPASAKTCARLDGQMVSATTPGFCQCSTDAICNGGTAGSLVCSDLTKLCTAKCTSNAQCPSGATCETSTGQCRGGSGSDAGMDAGVMDAGTACNGLGQCDYPEVCNFASGRCVAGASCNMSGVQPDTCGYAGYCTSNSNCAQVPAATCSNFAAGGATPATFNPTTSTGPIIYFVENDPSPPAASCFRGFFVHSFFINAYRTDADWPSQLSAIPGGWYVTSNGTKTDITAGLPGSYYTPTGRTMRLRKYLCAQQQASITAGFYFTGGNEYCVASSGAVAGTTRCDNSTQCGAGRTCNTGTGTCE
jgi:hypothetical protein